VDRGGLPVRHLPTLRGLALLAARIRRRPVVVEHAAEALDRAAVAQDDSELAAAVELDRSQSLTADEQLQVVAQDRAQVDFELGNFSTAQFAAAYPPCR